MVFITTDGEEEGQRVAKALLEAKVVACVNVIPQVSSRFWWEGKLDSAEESLLVAKTRRSALERVGEVVREVHSYDVPEIIALPIVWGSASYLEWIDEQVVG
ncbi:MAG: divalent-cation tolerance protein CutA [Deltaproteobacteria bacterium]|nr:divalent-cation tolerance protein CutA [Deltaproteobacteria bacterium]MBW2534124.1 divalent-cation tolerance protein CutA [Deltaproteobacteria bacterium]